MVSKNSPPEPMRAEIDRLRQILWDIARMTGYEGPDEAPATGRLDPDVPEIAVDSVKAHCADYLSYTGPQGRDVTPAAGPDDRCTCGQTITWLHDVWIHLYNDRLHARLHNPVPAAGYYEPVRSEMLPPDEEQGPSQGYSRGGLIMLDEPDSGIGISMTVNPGEPMPPSFYQIRPHTMSDTAEDEEGTF